MYWDGLYRDGLNRANGTCVISGDILHGVDLWEGVEDVKGANKKLVLQKRDNFYTVTASKVCSASKINNAY
jgi:hypothetical protein